MSTMRRMIERGEAAVEAASDQDAHVLYSEREMYLRDAITNIHHYADHYGLDWKNALDACADLPDASSESKSQPKQEGIENSRPIQEEIREDAERIDPRTAEMVWSYEQGVDPYGLLRKEEIPPELDCVGREYFLVDRARGTKAVLVSDVRAAHPEIPDEEWDELMRAAAKRDTSPDPVPQFHRWK